MIERIINAVRWIRDLIMALCAIISAEKLVSEYLEKRGQHDTEDRGSDNAG